MAVFNFPYHQPQIEYPDSSAQLRFGRGYQFASKPVGPDQLTFRLNFPGMFYYFVNDVLSSTIEPTLNFLTLQQFYRDHLMFEKFDYNHPTEGLVVCRFAKPLLTPKGIVGAVSTSEDGTARRHKLEPFDLSLISQP